MPYYKGIQRRLTDQYFSKYIRLRDGECVFKAKCPRYRGRDHWEINELQCCHFYSRGKESTRFDLQNCDAGCGQCHHFIDHTAEGKIWYREFKLKQLGQRDFDLLMLRANTPGKRDDKLTLIYVKELIKVIEQISPLSKLGYVPSTWWKNSNPLSPGVRCHTFTL